MEDRDEVGAKNLKCVICGSAKENDFKESSNANKKRESKSKGSKAKDQDHHESVLLEFCKELELFCPSGGRRLSLGNNLSVCSKCTDNMNTVLDTKEKMELVEGRVREMQLNIILELKEMQVYLDLLGLQLGKIERCVKQSDGQNFTSLGNVNRNLRSGRSVSKGKGENVEEGSDAISVRKCLMNVTKDLYVFRDELKKKIFAEDSLATKPAPIVVERNRNNSNAGDGFPRRTPQDPLGALAEEAYTGNEKDNSDNDDDDAVSSISNSASELELDFENENDVDSEEMCGDDILVPKIEPNLDLDPLTPSSSPTPQLTPDDNIITTFENCTRYGRKIKRVSSSKAMEVDTASDDDDAYSPEEEEAEVSDKEEDDLGSESDYEIEVRPSSTRRSKIRQRQSSRIQPLEWPYYLPENFDFEGISSFKKYVIESLAYRSQVQECNPENNEADNDNVDDAIFKKLNETVRKTRADIYSAEIRYNTENDTLHLKSVEIEINENEKSVKCGQCSFKKNVKWPSNSRHDRNLRMAIKLHICTRHLEMAKCPTCSQNFQCLKAYKTHLQKHKNIRQERKRPHICQVCGKAFTTRREMEIHKSRKHKGDAGDLHRRYYNLPENFDFTGMSEFKKYAVRSIMYRSATSSKQLDSITNDSDPASATTSKSITAATATATETPEEIVKKIRADITSTFVEYNAENCIFHVKDTEIKVDEEEKAIVCGQCPYKLKLKWPSEARHDSEMRKSLKAHVYLHHLKPVRCSTCSRRFRCLFLFKKHLMKHVDAANAKDYLCQVCGKQAETPLELQKHMWTHEGNAPDLTKTRPRPESDVKVEVEETGKKDSDKLRILCPDCGQLVHQFTLGSHRQHSCGLDAPRVHCSYCKMTFKNKDTRKKHIRRMHSSMGERPFQCVLCPKTFRTKRDLSRHVPMHSAERPFPCPNGCGKAFLRNRNLRQHQKRCKESPGELEVGLDSR